MTYVLDTNVLSALMKGEPAVVTRLAALGKESVTVPQPALAEIAYGLARLPRSKRRTLLEERFELLRAELFRAPWTDAVSEAFGAIKSTLERQGKPIEDFDAAIAAHALATGAVLVTANTRHMQRVPRLVIENWGP